MYPQLRLIRLFVLLALSVLVVSYDLPAQTKRKAPAKATAKKSTTRSKDAKKATSTASKKSNSKASSKSSTAKSKAEPARGKKVSAAERRRQEARRQAALAEQRRREQAAREARARKLAFERGLKNETAANILNDNVEGEDLRVRQTAVNALGERAGTVVVMEAKTGKIVTMVNQEWGIKQGFKPCSTIKLVTGVAGLNEKLIDHDGNLTNRSMQMNLDDALARSNNPYFQRVGANLGSEKMIDYAKKLGLGQKTGINAEGESVGKLPYGNNNPRIYSHADDFEVTPLQLAVMVTAISNGGKRITPQFQRSRTEKASIKSNYRGSVDLPETSRMGVIPGMVGAAEYGTARRGVDAGMGVAGKTGSCIGRGSWVGLFASVAPIEDPKYAVVVITRGEGERGRIAAGIAGQIYQVLSGDIRRDAEKMTALRNIRNRTQFNDAGTMPQTVAIADDEDEDDDASSADAALTESAPQRIAVPAAAQKPIQKSGVVKTVDSKPVFNPVVINYSKEGKANTAPAKPTPSASKPITSKPSTSKPVISSKPTAVPARSASAKPSSKVVTASKPAVKKDTNSKASATKKAPTTNKSNSSRPSTGSSKAAASKSKTSAATTKKAAASKTAASKTNAKDAAKNRGKNNTKEAPKKSVKPAAKAATKKPTDGKSRPRVIK